MRKRVTILLLYFTCGLLYGQQESTLVWPQPPDQARIRHVRTISSIENLEAKKGFWGKLFGFLFGSEHQQSRWFVQPVGVAVSPSGVIFVTDPGAHGVHIINPEKKEYDFLATTKYGDFRSPIGCAIDENNFIYITDSERGDVVVFDNDIDAVLEIKTHLVRPTGIQVVGDHLFVADAGQHTVTVFDRKGNYVYAFGRHGAGEGEFNFPIQLAVRESVMVVDALNYRIQNFDFAGHYSSTFGDLGDVSGRFASPKSIALDSDGNRYVTDALMDNFQIFNRMGQLLLVVGRKGTSNGEFMMPNGIFIDKSDKIYVVDALNRRLQIFQYLK